MRITRSSALVAVVALSAISHGAAAQDPCQTTYDSLNDFGSLAPFGLASGPEGFQSMVEESPSGQALASCPGLADAAWQDIVKAGQEARVKPATDHLELKTAMLVVVYGKDLDQHLEQLKTFLRARPWNTGLIFPAHLAVDALLRHHGDSDRDARYHTYTVPEMEAALKKYDVP